MDEVIAYTGSIASGVIVGVIVRLISLLLAEQQRTKREKLAEATGLLEDQCGIACVESGVPLRTWRQMPS